MKHKKRAKVVPLGKNKRHLKVALTANKPIQIRQQRITNGIVKDETKV